MDPSVLRSTRRSFWLVAPNEREVIPSLAGSGTFAESCRVYHPVEPFRFLSRTFVVLRSHMRRYIPLLRFAWDSGMLGTRGCLPLAFRNRRCRACSLSIACVRAVAAFCAAVLSFGCSNVGFLAFTWDCLVFLVRFRIGGDGALDLARSACCCRPSPRASATDVVSPLFLG